MSRVTLTSDLDLETRLKSEWWLAVATTLGFSNADYREENLGGHSRKRLKPWVFFCCGKPWIHQGASSITKKELTMSEACSGTQASDRFGITFDFVTKLKNDSIPEEEAKRFLRREPCWIGQPTPPPLLIFDDEHMAEVTLTGHDPAAFWIDTTETPARYVWGSFSTIAAQAKPTGAFGIVKVPYADLPRGAKVAEIRKTSGVGNLEPDHLSPLVAAMIAKQPNGEAIEHGLLVDDRGNFFPCGSGLVHVDWHQDYRDWLVYDWPPGLDVIAGRRVFSGNLVL